MRPLQERLASDFATVAIDWPGFGDEPRPPIPWQPAAYVAFLQDVLTHVVVHPFATIAAGHAASYALAAAAGVFRTEDGTAYMAYHTWTKGPNSYRGMNIKRLDWNDGVPVLK